MSITANDRRRQYTQTSGGQAFAVPFYFLSASDLTVIRTRAGVDTTLTNVTDYAVTGAGTNPSTAVVTMVAGEVDDTVTIFGNMAVTQPNTWAPNDRFPASTTEGTFDRLTMAIQQLYLDVKRSLRLPKSSAESSEMVKATWKNKLVGFDNNGVPTPSDPLGAASLTGTVIECSSYSAARALPISGMVTGRQVQISGYSSGGDGGDGLFAVTTSDPGADNNGTILKLAAGSVWLVRCSSGVVNVKWFGAKGDGATDDAAAINAAITAWLAQTRPGFLVFPPGDYLVASPVVINPSEHKTGNWGVLSEGATITADAVFTGANVLQIINSPDVQLRDFVMMGALKVVGSVTVTESVVLIDGSGVGASVDYTAFYKSVLRDVAVANFGFPLASTGGNNVHGVIIRGNFHESLIDSWRVEGGGTDTASLQGDGFRFEDGSYFVGGNVGLLRLKNCIVSATRRAIHQIGGKFDALFIESCGSFLSSLEAIKADSSARLTILNYHAEDAYNSNTNDADFTKAALNITYGANIQGLYVRGNGGTGQAKTAVSYFGAAYMTFDDIRISGTCAKILKVEQHRLGGFRELDASLIAYDSPNAVRASSYGRLFTAAGVEDIVYNCAVTFGYDYTGPYYFQIFPNLVRGGHIIFDVSTLEFAHATNYVDVKAPVEHEGRADHIATDGTYIFAINQGRKLRVTFRQNHATQLVTYQFDSVYKLLDTFPTLSAGEAVTCDFQYILSKWVEVSRSGVFTP